MVWDEEKVPNVSIIAAADWNALVEYLKAREKKITISETTPIGPAETDLWYVASTGKLHIYLSGAWVDLTLSGPTGEDGRTVLNGEGVPASGTGVDGDFYINMTTHDIYGPKTNGAWGSGTSLIGPQGAAGATGAAGVDGADGKTILNGSGAPSSGVGVDGDFYIDTTADAIYGPKTGGAWGSGTSLIGPAGAGGGTVDLDDYARQIHAAAINAGRTVENQIMPPGVYAPAARAILSIAAGYAKKTAKLAEAAVWMVPKRTDIAYSATNVWGSTAHDGTTNDTNAIQALINAAAPGAVLYFPAATYRIDGVLTVDKPIAFVGEHGTIFDHTNVTGLSAYNINTSQNVIDGITFYGIDFNGPGIDTAPICHDVNLVDHLTFHYCKIRNWGTTGLNLYNCSNVTVRDCIFDNIYILGEGYPIMLGEGCDRVHIVHNWFTTKAGRHAISQGGTGTDMAENEGCKLVVIEDNYIENSTEGSLNTHSFSATGPFIVRNNVFYYEDTNSGNAGNINFAMSFAPTIITDNYFLHTAGGVHLYNTRASYSPLPGKVDIIANNVVDSQVDWSFWLTRGNFKVYNNISRTVAGGYLCLFDSSESYNPAVLELVNNIYGPTDRPYDGHAPTLNTGNVYRSAIPNPQAGDILYFSFSQGAWEILARGSSGQFLKATSTSINWSAGEDGADGGAAPWTDAGAFSRTADSTFTVTDNATNQAVFVPGRPIRYRATASTWRYGIVTAYASGTVTLAGAPMTTGDDDEIQYGDMTRVVQVPVFIPGYFEDAADTTLIASDLGQELTWGQGTAYLVRVRARNRIADTGATDATVNVMLGGSAALSTGLTLAANATWYTSAVAVSTTNYEVSFDEVIEVSTTKGTNGNAQDLSVQMTFVVV